MPCEPYSEDLNIFMKLLIKKYACVGYLAYKSGRGEIDKSWFCEHQAVIPVSLLVYAIYPKKKLSLGKIAY